MKKQFKGTTIIGVEKVDDEFIKNAVLGKEFNLSEREGWVGNKPQGFAIYRETDIKEFIKRLKEEMKKGTQKAEICKCCWEEIQKEIIDKLAGDKLITKKHENNKRIS